MSNKQDRNIAAFHGVAYEHDDGERGYTLSGDVYDVLTKDEVIDLIDGKDYLQLVHWTRESDGTPCDRLELAHIDSCHEPEDAELNGDPDEVQS